MHIMASVNFYRRWLLLNFQCAVVKCVPRGLKINKSLQKNCRLSIYRGSLPCKFKGAMLWLWASWYRIWLHCKTSYTEQTSLLCYNSILAEHASFHFLSTFHFGSKSHEQNGFPGTVQSNKGYGEFVLFLGRILLFTIH